MQLALKRAALLAAGLLVFTVGTAQAAAVDVKVPFPFVVRGQQFAAGEYRLQRDEADSSVVMIRGEKGNTATLLVLTMPASGSDPAGDKAAVTFKRYENRYWLANVWEPGGQGRALRVGR